MLLSTPDGRQQLQQARLLATTGHTQEAIAAYDKLFDGNPPGGDVATEYWNVVAKDPARRASAINQLKNKQQQPREYPAPDDAGPASVPERTP